MTNPPPPSSHGRTSVMPPPSVHSLFNEHPPVPADIGDELLSLRRQLATLRASQVTPIQRAAILERLYTRTLAAVDTLSTALTSNALPIPVQKNTRLRIRNLQQLLRTLAEDFQATLAPDALPRSPGRALWRSLHALGQHLLISSLVASPAGAGIWRQLHQSYESARRLELTGYAPEGATTTIENIYFSAVLLGCAQPASFTSPEIAFIAAFLARYADHIDTSDAASADPRAAFWIDPALDTAAFACARRPPPPQTPVHYFSCNRLAERLGQQIKALESGATATQLALPELADTPAGRGVLRRLATHWGEPSKRRYPRRRQNYRATLCCGLGHLWRLFQDGGENTGEVSNWMITNESPDGYAFMHVSGKTGGLLVGDIAAIRTETGKSWQICIVRWAQSENQEHLELGLQILATQAQPARLALRAKPSDPTTLLAVLVLPALSALRTNELLVIPAAALENLPDKLILVVEKGNIEVRERICHRLEEQNSKIAILSIEPDATPG